MEDCPSNEDLEAFALGTLPAAEWVMMLHEIWANEPAMERVWAIIDQQDDDLRGKLTEVLNNQLRFMRKEFRHVLKRNPPKE